MGTTAFLYLYSSGKQVMGEKYRWVARITYVWHACGEEQDWTVRLYPDLIASPLEARMRAESFLIKRGYERIHPSKARVESDRQLMAELGLESSTGNTAVCCA
jgi:hypothetical protein